MRNSCMVQAIATGIHAYHLHPHLGWRYRNARRSPGAAHAQIDDTGGTDLVPFARDAHGAGKRFGR
ncbi:hypothetical protein GCM10027159_17660 [Lysobacter terrae]